ncbi:hypothetical protein T484DRAFT_1756184 [Baffinella frigidus]|nr:hypothetical protein T484DRAFT_1756184 [Cryptophyta sp. CCMP2293]
MAAVNAAAIGAAVAAFPVSSVHATLSAAKFAFNFIKSPITVVLNGDPVCAMCFFVACVCGCLRTDKTMAGAVERVWNHFKWDNSRWSCRLVKFTLTVLAMCCLIIPMSRYTPIRDADGKTIHKIYSYAVLKVLSPAAYDHRNYRMGLLVVLMSSDTPVGCYWHNSAMHQGIPAVTLTGDMATSVHVNAETCTALASKRLGDQVTVPDVWFLDFIFRYLLSTEYVPTMFAMINEAALCLERVITMTCAGFLFGFCFVETMRATPTNNFELEWNRGFSGQTTMMAWLTSRIMVGTICIFMFETNTPIAKDRVAMFDKGDSLHLVQAMLAIVTDPLVCHLVYRVVMWAGDVKTFNPLKRFASMCVEVREKIHAMFDVTTVRPAKVPRATRSKASNATGLDDTYARPATRSGPRSGRRTPRGGGHTPRGA